MVTVVCTRWLDAFPTSYVRLLRNAVRENLHRPHRFICVTDNPGALRRDGIEAARMPDMGIPLQYQKKGCWPKLGIFAPGVLPPQSPTLYLDLDLLVRDRLDAFFDRIEASGGFHALREWNPTLWSFLPVSLRPDRGVQGSILGFIPREQEWIYHDFMDRREAITGGYPLDQDYLTETVKDRHYWPFKWTASFKWHCVPYYPLNLVFPTIREPRKARIVVFHGKPRPIDVVPEGNYRWGTSRKFGYGPVPWVRDYWLRHDESWAEPGEQRETIRRAA